MQIKNETDTMLVISKWLDHFNINVWWNKKNEYFPAFHTKGRIRSDLLIHANDQYFVIECKNAAHKKNIYDSFFQLLDYSISETKYLVDKKPVSVGGFLIATEHSINGHLFDNKYDVLMTESNFSENRMWAVRAGQIPKCEHSMTEAICRMLWRGIKKYNIQYPVGVLLSNKLNGDSINPLILMKQGKKQYMEVLR